MTFKTRLGLSFLALGLLAAVSMGLLETYLIQTHFVQSSVEQIKLSAEQLVQPLAGLDATPEDSETCAEVAEWIYYNTGMQIVVTTKDGAIVADSSENSSLIGQIIDPGLLAPTLQNGETASFDLPLSGKDDIAISAPWRTGEEITGTLILIGPLKAYAREGMEQIRPFVIKAGLGSIGVSLVGAMALTAILSKKETIVSDKDSAAAESIDGEESDSESENTAENRQDDIS